MAKREFIETREIVYVNAPIAPILQGDSIHYEDIAFKSQIGRIHSFSEQDIVKPVLDKISAEIYNAIEFERKWLCDAGHTSKDIDIALNAIKSKVKDVLEKGAESEEGK